MIQMSIILAIIIYILGVLMYFYNGQINIIYILISLELLLLSISLLFLFYSFLFDDLLGSLFTLFLLPLAGAESALGLTLIVLYNPMITKKN